MHAVVLVKDRPTLAEVVQSNVKTLWVRLRDGHIVKRHREKHLVGEVIED